MDGNEKKAKVYSFEFGVGHPGLSTSTGGGSGLSEEDPILDKLKQQQKQQGNNGSNMEPQNDLVGPSIEQQISARKQETGTFVHRPYHTSGDLENRHLFQREDYGQYMQLRDKMMKDLFKITPLGRGGNKAKILAQKIREQK